MSESLFPAGRSLLIASLVIVALAGCGRRGPLEPPPDPTAQALERQRAALKQSRRASASPSGPAVEGQANAPGQAQVDDGGDADDPVAEGSLPAITPTARTRARTPYVIPREPFILDPLL